MNLIEINPNPIFMEDYPFKDELKEIILNEIKLRTPEKNDATEKLFHYGNNLNESILYKSPFESFRNWCEICCSYYITEILGYDLEEGVFITDSWINVCNLGGFQYPHLHSNSYISGTYYVNIEEGHSPLTFKHESFSPFSNKQILSLKKLNKITKYNSDATIFPENGQLILWQSNLAHGHFNNMKDNRISLSMNFMPTVMSSGKYGFKISPCTET